MNKCGDEICLVTKCVLKSFLEKERKKVLKQNFYLKKKKNNFFRTRFYANIKSFILA